jgi:hypothetical protein
MSLETFPDTLSDLSQLPAEQDATGFVILPSGLKVHPFGLTLNDLRIIPRDQDSNNELPDLFVQEQRALENLGLTNTHLSMEQKLCDIHAAIVRKVRTSAISPADAQYIVDKLKDMRLVYANKTELLMINAGLIEHPEKLICLENESEHWCSS